MRECVAALIVEGHRILLGKRAAERAFYPDVWDVFGGHVEPGESLEQALVRELNEELGIVPIAWRLLLTADEPEPERNGPGVYHFYTVTAWRGMHENRAPEEHSEIAWFTLAEAAQLRLAISAYVDLFAQVLPS